MSPRGRFCVQRETSALTVRQDTTRGNYFSGSPSPVASRLNGRLTLTRSLHSSVYWIFACVAVGCGGDDGPTIQEDPDAGSGGGAEFPQPVDRSKYANVGRDTKLDYANPAYWLCRPD